MPPSVWSDLSRDAQERLFAAAVDDGMVASDLAELLHQHHPETSHFRNPRGLRRPLENKEHAMAPKSKPRKDRERELREAVVEDADKTEGKDRDLVHGDGGTLGLDEDKDLNKDD